MYILSNQTYNCANVELVFGRSLFQYECMRKVNEILNVEIIVTFFGERSGTIWLILPFFSLVCLASLDR